MRNFLKIFSHILIWSIILLVPLYMMSKEGTIDSGPYISYIIRTSVFAVLFYINYLYLIDKFLFRKQLLAYIVANIILIASLILIERVLTDVLMPEPHFRHEREFNREKRDHPGPPFAIKMFFDYLFIVFVLGVSVAIKTTMRWYADSIKFEQAKSGQLEADLRNLRSQLNPHFLFNTLNNIYSLIAIDQIKAQDSVHRLSNLLRYVLYDNDSKLVPIEKELEFTQNYIDLMKLRVSSNVKLNVLIENKGSNDMIASLMFMTLIENAFKHGLSSKGDCFIDIKILVEKETGVLCTVENSLPDTENRIEAKNSGIGLTNLTKRLELIYPGKHEFTVEHHPNSFSTLLRIDFT